MDMISQLPEPIQHHILSFLKAKEATKTSLLSKTWRGIAQSRPILDFKQSYYAPNNKHPFDLKDDEIMTMESTFHNHVQECMHRLNSTIQKVNIELEIYFQARSGPKLNRWIQKLATESRIKEFSIIIHCYDRSPAKYYQLPPVLLCLKTITILSLRSLKFKDCSNMNLPNLLKLRLKWVALSQEDINNFTSGCPSLEILELCYCTGLSSICVSGLARLNTLVLEKCINLSQARIVAPMLRIFEFWIHPVIIGKKHVIVDMLACESTLRVLRLKGAYMTKERLKSCVSKFIYLDELFLDSLDLESIEISNQNIRKLDIRNCCELEKVEIAAPDRLQVLKFVYNKLPFYSVSSKSSLNDTIEFYGSFFIGKIGQPLLFSNWSNSFENFFLEFNQFKGIQMAIYHMEGVIICEERDKERFIEMLHQLKDKIRRVEIKRRNVIGNV